jgi:hypothetical protein
MSFATIIAYCDLLAVGVFAVSGALAAAEKRLDMLGFLFFGTVTGVGGGTLRDLLLDIPVFWISDTRYLWVCAALSALTWYLAPLLYAAGTAVVGRRAGPGAVLRARLREGAADGAPDCRGGDGGDVGELRRADARYAPGARLGAARTRHLRDRGPRRAASYALLALAPLDASVALILAMLPAFKLRAGAIVVWLASARVPTPRSLNRVRPAGPRPAFRPGRCAWRAPCRAGRPCRRAVGSRRASSPVASICAARMPAFTGVVDGHGRHGYAGRHLHDRQQRCPRRQLGGGHRYADYRQHRQRRHHARQMRRAAGTGDDDAQAARLRSAGVVVELVRRAVRRDDLHLVGDLRAGRGSRPRRA